MFPDIYWFETIYDKIYIKERINDRTTICAGGVTGNTTYLGLVSMGFNNMMHTMHEHYKLYINKWEALIRFLGEKERKKHVGGKKEKKKNSAFARPCVELSPFMNTVYQRIELI